MADEDEEELRVQTGASTLRFSDATRFVWKVHGFDECGVAERLKHMKASFPAGVGVRSPNFSLCGIDAWYAVLYPGGDPQQAAAIAKAKVDLAKWEVAYAAWRNEPDETREFMMPVKRSMPKQAMTLLVCCGARGAAVDVDGVLRLLGDDGRPIDEVEPEDDYGYDYQQDQYAEPVEDVTFTNLPYAPGPTGADSVPAAEVVLRMDSAIDYELFSKNVSSPFCDADGALTLELTLYGGLRGAPGSGAGTAPAAAAPPTALGTQLAALLASGAGADAALRAAGGETLRVHRWLLASRSPVLATALTDPAWATPDAPVEVDDMDEPTLRAFVKYLYSEDAAPVHASRELALAMLAASDKYDVPSLRAAAEAALGAVLCVDGAADTLRAAARHGATALRTRAAAFVRAHLDEVTATPGWATLLAEAPLLQVEILQALVAEREGALRPPGAKRPRDEADAAGQ